MAIVESLKKVAERATGRARPSHGEIEALVRARKANALKFKDDGVIPNNPRWPLVLYRGAISLPAKLDSAAVMEELFDRNGWGDSWRNGVYDYVHYHSCIHEVLGIAKGSAKVRFGGNKGKTVQLKAGDVAILPAGTGHQCLDSTLDFLVVGAYPPSGTYDHARKAKDMPRRSKLFPRSAVRARTPCAAPRDRF